MSLPVPELQQLHYNILDYLTKRSRIMSACKLNAWNEFAAFYNYQYSDYSREDLRKEFLTTILPKVFTYNLTSIQRRKVEIFATHYHYERSSEGFTKLPTRSRLPVEGVDYVTSEADTQFPNVACVVSQPETNHEIPPHDQRITAWTSAINSSDAEVASYCQYRGLRLRARVTRTWDHFHQTGELPQNMNVGISTKIIDFRNKAEKLSSMINGPLK